jgi:hypothetical protein
MRTRARHLDNGPVEIPDSRVEAKRYLRRLLPTTNGSTRIYHHMDSPDKVLYDSILGYIHPTHRLGVKGIATSNILHAVAFRVNKQSRALATFLALHDSGRGLISSRGLAYRVRFYGEDVECLSVIIRLLKSFEFFWHDEPSVDQLSGRVGYDFAVVWLASMIVRGAAIRDLERIMRRVQGLGTLGSYSHSHFLDMSGNPPVRGELRSAPAVAEQVDKICFWLPEGLDGVIDVRMMYEDFEREFNLFDGLYMRYFGYSLMDDPPHRHYRPRSASIVTANG